MYTTLRQITLLCTLQFLQCIKDCILFLDINLCVVIIFNEVGNKSANESDAKISGQGPQRNAALIYIRGGFRQIFGEH